jgi:UDP-N-acetylmuramate-alanine ligase
VRNALAASIACLEAGASFDQLAAAFTDVSRGQRRLELRGEFVAFGFTTTCAPPTAVRETVAALRSRLAYDERIIVVFEPRSYTSRTKVFEKDLRHRLRHRR